MLEEMEGGETRRREEEGVTHLEVFLVSVSLELDAHCRIAQILHLLLILRRQQQPTLTRQHRLNQKR